MKMSLLHSIRLFSVAACIFAMSSLGTVSAHQRGDAWTELGEDFTGTTTSTTVENPVDGDTFVLPTSGAEVVLAEGFVPEESDFEDQIIVNFPQGMGAIGVLQGLGTPLSVMESYAGGFAESSDGMEEIDVQSDREFASGLYSVDLLGLSVFMFITVDAVAIPGYLVIQVAIAETDIAETISIMRENIALEGQPVFTGVDELEVQDTVDDFLGA